MNAGILINLIQTAVLVLVLLGTIRILTSGRREVRTVFFAFAVASVLLSNLYWLAYDILRPGTRMPFAANEIGEWAMFLLLGAALGAQSAYASARKEIICTALFTAANVALWIAWSGEWMQDILTGAAFGYFLCCLIVRIKQEEAFSARAWRLLGCSCLVLVAAQAAIFFVPDVLKKPFDLFCYCLLFLMSIFFLVKAALAIRTGTREAGICCAFAAFAWVTITMYMSANAFYLAANVLCTISWLLMLLALRKEVAAV